jgi:predicted outer membrane repeat protein
MWWHSLFGQRKSRTRHQTSQRPARFRPRLEALEDRLAPAQLLVTSSLDDSSPNTLRAVLTTANVDAANGISDTIIFDPGLAGAAITLTQGQLGLTGAGSAKITIDGSSLSTPITISGNNASQILVVWPGVQAELDNLQLVNGSALYNGGAISNSGTLTITGCALSGNIALGNGGAISNAAGSLTLNSSSLTGNRAGSSSGFTGAGGAIWNVATLAVNGCTLSGNSAGQYGGGICNGRTDPGNYLPIPVATISNSMLTDNFTQSALPLGHWSKGGGGVYNRGQLTLDGTTLSGNSTPFNGGVGIGGGGIFNDDGTVTISNHSVISGNSSGAAGGIFNTSRQDYPSPSTGGQVSISNSTLSNNVGGGIVNRAGQLNIDGSALSGNSSNSQGGGIVNGAYAAATISGSVLSGNSSSDLGGGIYSAGDLTISGSQLTANSGSALVILGSRATLSGCTVSGNTGDGIDIRYGGVVTVANNSTIVNNQGPDIVNGWQLTITASTLGSLALGASSTVGPVVTCDAPVAQTAADAAAQMPAPLVDVYDSNEIQIGVAPYPVTITLNLTQGTYHDLTLSTQDNVTLLVNGVNGSVGTVTGTTIVGNSPALVVTGGNIIINNVAFTTATNAPTILVTGGNLTLRNDTVQESTGFTNAAIRMTGGSLDLGTSSSPGGNTLSINGAGQFVIGTASTVLTAVGTTYQINGVLLPLNQIDEVIAQVAELHLTSDQRDTLTSKLQAAEQALLQVNTTTAAHDLNAFANELDKLADKYRVSQVTADSLIDDVTNLIDGLPDGSSRTGNTPTMVDANWGQGASGAVN